MSEVILCNISDANEILKEKRDNWTYDILERLGLSEAQNTTDIFEFRNYLNQFGIYIESKSGGQEIDIYKREWFGTEQNGGWLPVSKKYLIAQWKIPKYIRKIENKDVYYEIHLNEWCMVK